MGKKDSPCPQNKWDHFVAFLVGANANVSDCNSGFQEVLPNRKYKTTLNPCKMKAGNL